jgi:excisionase family DNA binding protein
MASQQAPSDGALLPPSEAALASLSRAIATVDRKLDQLRELCTGQRKEHLTVAEVAALTGRSEFTTRRWISQGRLKATRLAEGGPRGRLLIARAELDRLVASGKGGEIPDSAVG